MPMKTINDLASAIREYAARAYVKAAKQQGLKGFTIRAGDVHREMGFKENRVPAVCSALKSHKFLMENGLRLLAQSGPPSGMSTTVRLTYEFIEVSGDEPQKSRPDSFLALRGILRDVFQDLGGGENFIKKEREAWGVKTDVEDR
jgi:hypothetical protein